MKMIYIHMPENLGDHHRPVPQTDEEIQEAIRHGFEAKTNAAIKVPTLYDEIMKKKIEGSTDFKASDIVMVSDPELLTQLQIYLKKNPPTIPVEDIDQQLRNSLPRPLFR